MKKPMLILSITALCLLVGCNSSTPQSNILATDSSPATVSSESNNLSSSITPVDSMSESGSADSDFTSGSSDTTVTQSLPATSQEVALNTGNRNLPENIDEEYITGLGDLSGFILRTSPEGFSFEGGSPNEAANGEYATVVTELEAEIAYTGETIFLYAEYERATDKSTCYMGSVEDVVQGRDVAVWGAYEGDVFVPTAVRVVVFI